MTDLQVFKPPFVDGYELRATLMEGTPWFVAADVCAILGVRVRDVMSALDDDEKMRDTVAGMVVDLISEPAVYSAVFRSRKAEAVQFKRWVTHEVLPSIRRTGSYGASALPSSPRELAMMVIAEADRADRATAELEAAKPAIEAHAAYMDAEGLCTMATAAAALHIGRNSLFDELRRAGVLISTPGAAYNTPKARYKRVPHGLGWFEIKTGTRERSSGELEATYTTMVTSKGIEGIRKLLVL